MEIDEAIRKIMDIEHTESQKELGKILKVSQGTISNYLTRKIYPSLTVAAYIYAKYDIQVEPYTERALRREDDWQKKYGSV